MKYVSLLRAINVSGQKLIKMEALREMFDMPGIKNVKTYIQSGNIIFDAKETDEAKLLQKIEKKLHQSLGYQVDSFLRTETEMAAIIKHLPFKKVKEDDKVYVCFLHQAPNKEQAANFMAMANKAEEFVIKGREVYICLHPTDKQHLFSNKLLEQKTKLGATTRNWHTVNKIHEMMQETES